MSLFLWDAMVYDRKRKLMHAFPPATPFAVRVLKAKAGALKIRQRRRTAIGALSAQTATLLGVETKFYDTNLVGAGLAAPVDSTAGELDPSATIMLNTIVQGDGEQNRDGRKATMLSVHVKGNVSIPPQVNQTTLDTQGIVFLALVLDKQTNGAQLNSEDVFANPSADSRTAPMCFLNLNFRQRFEVLKTVRLVLEQPRIGIEDGTNTDSTGVQQPFDMYHHFGEGLATLYNGTTESVANIVDNSLHMIGYVSNSSYVPVVTYISRLRFRG